MTVESDFVEYLVESLKHLGPVRARKMFGGFGIFLDELMFGLVSKNRFYLKADDTNRPDFDAKGLGPFTYIRKGKECSLSYYEVHYETLDDAEELCKWAEKAHDAALRAAESKLAKKRNKLK